MSIGVHEILSGGFSKFELNQKVQFATGQIALHYTTIEKVAELCMPLESLVDGKSGRLVVIAIEQSFCRSFAASPLEDLAFNDAGDGESEMRSPRFHRFRSQELQQEAERLLSGVCFGKFGLTFNSAANRAVQHRGKHDNE